MYKPFVFRLSSFVFVPVPLPVPALVFVLLLLLLFLLTHDVCVGWGVLFVVVLLFLCVVCCAGSVSVCFLFVPSSLMRPCDLVILLFCCALSVCNVCVLSLPVVLPVGLLFAMSCFFVLALVCWFLFVPFRVDVSFLCLVTFGCRCPLVFFTCMRVIADTYVRVCVCSCVSVFTMLNLPVVVCRRRCVSSCMYLRVYMQIYVYVWSVFVCMCICMSMSIKVSISMDKALS